MAMDMQPQQGEYSINIPITFDYRGGRGENKKTKFIVSLILVVVTIIATIGVSANDNLETWQRILFGFLTFYVGVALLRYIVFNELYFSDMYEGLKRKKFKLRYSDLWNIFDIDTIYPYVCYFKNGTKGIFVRMEKDAITGKPEGAMFDHYEAISDAYNVAHSLNMNICHIDYMDNVGNDPRLNKMLASVGDIHNVDMRDMMIDIYSNLQYEMRRNYCSFDVYLFITRDTVNNFLYNVQQTVNMMLGGNFITYKIMNRAEINTMCKALWNLHGFSVVDACADVLTNEVIGGIIPISVKYADGTVEKLNKTQAEKRAEKAVKERRARDAYQDKQREKMERKQTKRNRHKRKGANTGNTTSKDDELELF